MRQIIRWTQDWRFVRDILSFLLGGVGLAWEMVRGFHSPTVALICAALMGVPVFFQPRPSKNGNSGN